MRRTNLYNLLLILELEEKLKFNKNDTGLISRIASTKEKQIKLNYEYEILILENNYDNLDQKLINYKKMQLFEDKAKKLSILNNDNRINY